MTTQFIPETLFHLDDPETSRLAAINLDGVASEQVCHAIVDLIDERGALAPWELERVYFDLRGRRGWPRIAFYTHSPARVSDETSDRCAPRHR